MDSGEVANRAGLPPKKNRDYTENGPLANVLLPETLSQKAQIGQISFEAKCAACHWLFSDMPAVEGITTGDVTMIIAYIRELHRANGIN